MFGAVSKEILVNVAAKTAWEVYGTFKLKELVEQSGSPIVDKVEILEGVGNVGTLAKLYFVPGTYAYTPLLLSQL